MCKPVADSGAGIAFTEPEIAMVGLPHAALPDNAVSAAHDFSRQSRALAMRSAAGLLKVYAEPGSGRLLGAEMMTPHAEHLAHLLALAIEREMTVAVKRARSIALVPFTANE